MIAYLLQTLISNGTEAGVGLLRVCHTYAAVSRGRTCHPGMPRFTFSPQAASGSSFPKAILS